MWGSTSRTSFPTLQPESPTLLIITVKFSNMVKRQNPYSYLGVSEQHDFPVTPWICWHFQLGEFLPLWDHFRDDRVNDLEKYSPLLHFYLEIQWNYYYFILRMSRFFKSKILSDFWFKVTILQECQWLKAKANSFSVLFFFIHLELCYWIDKQSKRQTMVPLQRQE